VVLGWPDRVEAEILGRQHQLDLLVEHLLLCMAVWRLKKLQKTELHGVPPVSP
jgi:hypothetical protein